MSAQKDHLILSHSIAGSGRAFVVLAEENCRFSPGAEMLPDMLSDLGQIHFVCLRDIGKNWRAALQQLVDFLEHQNIRNASFIAFEDASVLVQALCLRNPRMIRTLCFIDGATRAHPSSFVKLVDRIERFLPLGLPFRSDFKGFDGKPFLQRIRCPVLIGLSVGADDYRREQAALFVNSMPTSFLINFRSNELINEVAEKIREFQNVPAKMPQRRISA